MTVKVYQDPTTLKLRVRIFGLPEHVSDRRLMLNGCMPLAGFTERSGLPSMSGLLRKRPVPRYQDADSSFSHQFLCLVPFSITFRETRQYIQRQFMKLYPEDGFVVVKRLRDEHDCDLDDDYRVGEVFSNESVILAICSACETAEPEPTRPFLTPLSHVEEAYLMKSVTPLPPLTTKESTNETLPQEVSQRRRKRSRKKGDQSQVDEVAKKVIKPEETVMFQDFEVTKPEETITFQNFEMSARDPILVHSPRPVHKNIAELAAVIQAGSSSDSSIIDRILEPEPSLLNSETTNHATPLSKATESKHELFKTIETTPSLFPPVVEADSEESEDSTDDEPIIPVIRSESVTQLQESRSIESIKAILSSSSEAEGESLTLFTQPRTSLTELTQAVRRDSVNPNAPQSIRTKALLETSHQRRRKHKARRENKK